MVTHVLDTSALLAHILNETGMERVSSLLRDKSCKVTISTPSILELYMRMKMLNKLDQWSEVYGGYCKVLEPPNAITEEVCLRAIEIRDAATERIPTIDSLIAATASVQKAILVHRDAHFISIPENLLKQESLD